MKSFNHNGILEVKLNKGNWRTLRELNIIDGGEGNGFADTTKVFEDFVNITTNVKYIRTKNNLFSVRYVSGCFYPIWTNVLTMQIDTVLTEIVIKQPLI